MSEYESLRLAASAVEMADEWYTKKTIFSFPNYECDEDFVVEASPERVLALIAENESLRKDAERYRLMRKITLEQIDETQDEFDAEFDRQTNRSPENH